MKPPASTSSRRLVLLKLRHSLSRSELSLSQRLKQATQMIEETRVGVLAILDFADSGTVFPKNIGRSEWKQAMVVVNNQLDRWQKAIRDLTKRVTLLVSLELVVNHYDTKLGAMRDQRQSLRLKPSRLRDSGLLEDMIEQVNDKGLCKQGSLSDEEVAMWMSGLADPKLKRNQQKLQKAQNLYETTRVALQADIFEVCEAVTSGQQKWKQATPRELAYGAQQNPKPKRSLVGFVSQLVKGAKQTPSHDP